MMTRARKPAPVRPPVIEWRRAPRSQYNPAVLITANAVASIVLAFALVERWIMQ
jgi:hypothetical protein